MSGSGVVVRLIGRMCTVVWGYAPGLVPAIVAKMGTRAALGWFMANFPRYLVTLQILGPIRTHLAGVAISLRNGCVYCAYGQAHALELIYLREHDVLFPLDARTLDTWVGQPPRELATRLRHVLEEAGLHSEVVLVERTFALVEGDALPTDSTEVRIAHLCRMIGTMNAVAIEAGIRPDGAQNSVNKDTVLKERLARLQAAR